MNEEGLSSERTGVLRNTDSWRCSMRIGRETVEVTTVPPLQTVNINPICKPRQTLWGFCVKRIAPLLNPQPQQPHPEVGTPGSKLLGRAQLWPAVVVAGSAAQTLRVSSFMRRRISRQPLRIRKTLRAGVRGPSSPAAPLSGL